MRQQIAKEYENDKTLSVIVGEKADTHGIAPADTMDDDEDEDSLDEESREALRKVVDKVGIALVLHRQ